MPFALGEAFSTGSGALFPPAGQALEGRMCGTYAKGTLAYDAWKDALLRDQDFPRRLLWGLRIKSRFLVFPYFYLACFYLYCTMKL